MLNTCCRLWFRVFAVGVGAIGKSLKLHRQTPFGARMVFLGVCFTSNPPSRLEKAGLLLGLGTIGESPKANPNFRFEKGDLLIGLEGVDCHEKQTPTLRSKTGGLLVGLAGDWKVNPHSRLQKGLLLGGIGKCNTPNTAPEGRFALPAGGRGLGSPQLPKANSVLGGPSGQPNRS